jgi:hypothetical protein
MLQRQAQVGLAALEDKESWSQ